MPFHRQRQKDGAKLARKAFEDTRVCLLTYHAADEGRPGMGGDGEVDGAIRGV